MANNLAVATRVVGKAKLVKHQTASMPVAEYQLVTPGQAQLWLDKAALNRNVMWRKVEVYAAMMKRGDWLQTGQGIIFNESGELIDGQHRLLAVVKADIPIWLMVTTGVKARAQLVMDQGMLRKAHDQIHIQEGFECQPVHIAVAKCMITSVGGSGEQARRATLTDVQLMDRYYVKHRKAIEFTVDRFWRVGSTVKGVTVAPAFAPVARAWYSQDHPQLERFIHVVLTGMAEAKEDSPAVVLRNWLIAGRDKGLSSRVRGERYTIYRKSEIALNAFLTGKSIQRLSQMGLEYELYPIPGDKKEKDDDAK